VSFPVPRDPARAIWLSSLHLVEDPFDSAPDSRFLYFSSQHGPVLDRMHNLVERRHGLSIVDGGRSLGKTLLARRLESYYRARSKEFKVTVFDQPSFNSEYTAYLALSTALNIKPKKGTETQWTELATHINARAHNGCITLFILDNAEHLNAEVLAGLDRVAQEIAPMFLFGRESIQVALAELPDTLSRATRMTLTPLSLREAVGLVRFRTTIAGRDDDLFTSEALAFLWEAARGIPGDLVELCNLSLAELRSVQGKIIDLELARAASDSFGAYSPLTEQISAAEQRASAP